MGYHLDDRSIDLGDLQARLKATDLIPSQEPLLEGMAENMAALTKVNVNSLADLRLALKTEKSLKSLSESSGVDVNYLKLLRRTVNGFFPKPRAIKEIDWLEADIVTKLNKIGIKDTRQYFEAASEGVANLAKRAGISQRDAQTLFSISNLCRIQWVSPTFARAITAAGVDNPADVAKQDPEAFCQAIATANKRAKYFKGTVGLRDFRRLVAAAAYLP